MQLKTRILILLCIFSLFEKQVNALECYVCHEQEENHDKCSKTVKQCAEDEDTCQTSIFWTSPVEMTPRGERRHYLSKSCATSDQCQKQLYSYTPVCTRNWYDDWSCVECCKGDRCNKYVFLGASSTSLSLKLFLSMVLVSVAYVRGN